MKIKFKSNYTRTHVSQDLKNLYLFTDNLDRTSGSNAIQNIENSSLKSLYLNKKYPNVSQAVIRGLNNAYPITTKHGQYLNNQFVLDHKDLFYKTIDSDIERILTDINKFDFLISPMEFATSYAILPLELCQYLQSQLDGKLNIFTDLVSNKNGFGLKVDLTKYISTSKSNYGLF